MKKILLALFCILFYTTLVFATLTPQKLFDKPLMVQKRNYDWSISTTFIKVALKDSFGIIIQRSNGIWEEETPTQQNPLGSIWLFNITKEEAQPYIDEFKKTLMKDLESIPNEIIVTVGIWPATEEIIIYFSYENTGLEKSDTVYKYMLEKMRSK